MRECLCAVDFSESSRRALTTARDVAIQYGSSLTVCHTYRLLPNQTATEVQEFKELMENNARVQFEAMEPLLKAGSIAYRFTTNIGFLGDGVRIMHRKTPVGLLVISQELFREISEHEEGFSYFLNKVAVPVLIVP